GRVVLALAREGRGRRAGGSAGPVFAGLLAEGRPGDVDLRPRDITDELLEEQPGRDGPAPADPHVLHVRDGRLDVPPVVRPQGQLPAWLAFCLAGREEI